MEVLASDVMEGGNPLLKDMAVPAGLFFLQHAVKERTYNEKVENKDSEMMPESLYNRLFSLVSDTTSRKTRKVKKRGNGRKTKKNN